MAQTIKNLPAMQETRVWCLVWEDPLKKGMAAHSCILARRIPWTEELGGLQSWDGRVNWTTNTFTFTNVLIFLWTLLFISFLLSCFSGGHKGKELIHSCGRYWVELGSLWTVWVDHMLRWSSRSKNLVATKGPTLLIPNTHPHLTCFLRLTLDFQ